MALSGSTDFKLNRNQIITAALRKINVIASGETPSAADITDAAEALNLMLKSWQTKGFGMWLSQPFTLFLAKDQQSYQLGESGDHATHSYTETTLAADVSTGSSTITVASAAGLSSGDAIGIELDDGTRQWVTISGAPSGTTVTLSSALTDSASEGATVFAYTTILVKPLDIFAVRAYDGSDETVMRRIVVREYMEQPSKDSTGQAIQYSVKNDMDYLTVYVWPVCDDVSQRINGMAKIRIEDLEVITDDVHFPVEWHETIVYNLAERLIPDYGVNITPAINLMIARAQSLKADAMGFDLEHDSVRFIVNWGR